MTVVVGRSAWRVASTTVSNLPSSIKPVARLERNPSALDASEKLVHVHQHLSPAGWFVYLTACRRDGASVWSDVDSRVRFLSRSAYSVERRDPA